MEPFALATIACAVALVVLVAAGWQLAVTSRRVAALKDALEQERKAQFDLIGENTALTDQVQKLIKYRVEYFNLSRDHRRSASSIQYLCQIEAGLTAELTKAKERNLELAAKVADAAALEAENAKLRSACEQFLTQHALPHADFEPAVYPEFQLPARRQRYA